MEKVGIITKMSKNYGAVLQAYALKTLIEKSGKKVEIINYNGKTGNQSYSTFSKIDSLGSLRYNAKRLFHAKGITDSSFKFNEFRSKYFNLTKPYNGYEELKKDPPKDDVYIVGSDQVWNPQILFSPIYFLAFGDKDIVRASYAASFGNASFPKNLMDELRYNLSNLDYISVREDSGLNILTQAGYKGQTVLDPTLMLDTNDWLRISEKPEFNISKPYILTYFLNYNENVRKYCNELKRRTGLTIINICSNVWNPGIGDYDLWNIGPGEFIWLIEHAEYVVTSSFHGTAFSIIYDKKFLSINIHPDDSRLKNILSKFNICHRVVDTYSEAAIDMIIHTSETCRTTLEQSKEASREFVQNIFK